MTLLQLKGARLLPGGSSWATGYKALRLILVRVLCCLLLLLLGHLVSPPHTCPTSSSGHISLG